LQKARWRDELEIYKNRFILGACGIFSPIRQRTSGSTSNRTWQLEMKPSINAYMSVQIRPTHVGRDRPKGRSVIVVGATRAP
jgi:hypothetical protein